MSDGTYTLTVPQYIMDHYSHHFNNRTYGAVAAYLDALAVQYTHIDGTTHFMVMNLLIDASYERSGAEFYKGAEQRLIAMLKLVPTPDRIIELCQIHLDNFGSVADQ